MFVEFIELLHYALNVIKETNLTLKREKCFFGLAELHILGHVVFKDGVQMHEGRIDAVLEVAFPRNAKKLRRIFGMTIYMHNFIPGYSVLVTKFQTAIKRG